MEVEYPEFHPDPELDREAMTARQRALADVATFGDDCGPIETVAGIDQAFNTDGTQAVSTVVVMQDGDIIEETTAVRPVEIPYVPGLLAFREGPPIIAALSNLETDPDCLLVDGSGRIHFRQAGLATHIGVLYDQPAIGVAKSLLCGTPVEATDGLATGETVPIVADEDVTAPDRETIGYAVQTRQFESQNRHINPVYVSPGHRIGPQRATDVVRKTTAGYKLPEPIRQADKQVDKHKAEGIFTGSTSQ